MDQRDYYATLEVERTATAEEIRKAYRRLARMYHPDVNKAPDAATRFAAVQEAYDVLSDASKRKAYDQFGRDGVKVGAGPGGFGGWGEGFGRGGVDDLSSIFEEMFGGAGPFGGGPFGRSTASGPRRPTMRERRARAEPQRGEDLRETLPVPFMTAALGGTEELRRAAQTISVRIPPGLESGAVLRIRGAGAPGNPPGDLLLAVTVGDHPYFRRQGLDLYIDLPVTIAEAALGAKVDVPLLDGSVGITVPPGTGSGQKLRVRGKGLRDARGRQGDYYAVVQVAAPRGLSERGRQVLGEVAGELQNPRDSAPWAAGRG
jgi:curved DNA-binding protein